MTILSANNTGQTLYGTNDNDTITGGTGKDVLYGGAGNDYLDGGDGNNSLDGGTGNDSIYGGIGNDTFIGGAGNDHLSDIGGNNYFDAGLGNDTVYGDSGNDTIIAGDGNDSVIGWSGDDSINGGNGDDYLSGGDGNDTLVGGTGINDLRGGSGNDVYYISNDTTYIYDSAGIDTVYVSASFVKVPSSIENVTYLNGAQALPYWIDALLPDATAGLYYLTLLDSSKNINYVFPTSLPTYYTDAVDTNGWSAFTSVQQTRAKQALTYISSVIGINFVQSSVSNALNTIVFANNNQILDESSGYSYKPSNYFFGYDLFLDNSSESPSNANLKDGTYGALTLIHEIGHTIGLKHPGNYNAGGGGANPPYLSGVEDSTTWTVMSYTDYPAQYYLQFSALDIAALQYLYGPSPTARTGADTYQVSAATSNFIWDGAGKDTITLANVGQAATVYLTPGYWGYVGAKSSLITSAGQVTVNFGTVIEQLIGSNYSDSLYGNEVDNTIDGGTGNDHIEGWDGNDYLSGGAGNDKIYGGDGDDIFDWDSANRGGNDIFYGGQGNDEFVLDSGNDTVVEYANEGNDLIWVSFSYSIAAQLNIEWLYGFGSSNLTLIGNINDNYLDGSAGNDSIDGGAGIDYVFVSNEKYSDCIITASGSTYTIQTKINGTDILKNIEYVMFSDRTYDLSLLGATPTYILTATKTSFDEGSTATLTLTTTNVTSGTSVPYTLSGISAADVSGGSLSGSAVVTASGVATISATLLNDSLTEGAETLTVTAGGATASTVVNDTSKTAAYSLSASSSSVNEGSTATFTLTTTNVTSGTAVASRVRQLTAPCRQNFQ